MTPGSRTADHRIAHRASRGSRSWVAPDRVYTLAFGADGRTLISGGQDHTARLWDVDPEGVAGRVCAVTGAALTRANWD